MKLIKGNIKEDSHRDVFWQKSYIESEEGDILLKIIICASQEFLSSSLNIEMKDVQIDKRMQEWFQLKTEQLYAKAANMKDFKETESLFGVYPQTNAMLDFAQGI